MKTYMVTERFRPGCFDAAIERYQSEGRLLPEGLNYLNSWINREKYICYQLMETNRPELFEVWFRDWSDLVEFELVAID